MARYPTGQPVRLKTEVRDVTGQLANAGAITLTVQKPDLTTQVYSTPTNDGTGLYHQDIPTADIATVGHYQYKWVSTGANAGVSAGAFDVFDPFEPELLSLEDAKAYLGETGTGQDEEIRAFARVATEVVESIVGPVVPRVATVVVYPSSGVLLLPFPVVSLTSITPYAGVALNLASLDQSGLASGIVRPGMLAFFSASYYTVVCVAGRNPIPDRYVHAAKEELRHLWTTQRGQTVDSPLPDFSGDSEFAGAAASFGAGFSVPNRVQELLTDRIPGIA